MQFENKIIDTNSKDGNCDNEFELDELGKDRWQLVAVSNYKFYFVRSILTLHTPTHESLLRTTTRDECIHPGSYIDTGGWHCPVCGENKNI